MNDDELKTEYLEFFVRNGSGCAFAAHASREPERLEWGLVVLGNDELGTLDQIIADYVDRPAVSTLSIIFRDVQSDAALDELLPELNRKMIFLHETLDTELNRCYRFRARVGDDLSFVSGFAPFGYMPITRQTQSVSIVMRVGPRPQYDWHLKEPTPGIVHVADMDMKGVPDRNLRRMWQNSFLRTAGLLGHKPDEESAAKTSFVVPLDRAQRISI